MDSLKFFITTVFAFFISVMVLQDIYAYLTYPSYDAKIVKVLKYEDDKSIMYTPVYRFYSSKGEIELKSSFSTSKKMYINDRVKVKYKDGLMIEDSFNMFIINIFILFAMLGPALYSIYFVLIVFNKKLDKFTDYLFNWFVLMVILIPSGIALALGHEAYLMIDDNTIDYTKMFFIFLIIVIIAIIVIPLSKNYILSKIKKLSPLQKAILNDDFEKFNQLVNQQNINLEYKNSNKQTALHIAASNKNDKYIRILLKKGANINAVDINNTSALHEARASNISKNVKLLLKKGAKDDIQVKKTITKKENRYIEVKDMTMFSIYAQSFFASIFIIVTIILYVNDELGMFLSFLAVSSFLVFKIIYKKINLDKFGNISLIYDKSTAKVDKQLKGYFSIYKTNILNSSKYEIKLINKYVRETRNSSGKRSSSVHIAWENETIGKVRIENKYILVDFKLDIEKFNNLYEHSSWYIYLSSSTKGIDLKREFKIDIKH